MELWRYNNLIQHEKESGIPVLVLFTDSSKKIYGEWVKNLKECKSYYGGTFNKANNVEMIYWLLEKLKDYQELIQNFLNFDIENCDIKERINETKL